MFNFTYIQPGVLAMDLVEVPRVHVAWGSGVSSLRV